MACCGIFIEDSERLPGQQPSNNNHHDGKLHHGRYVSKYMLIKACIEGNKNLVLKALFHGAPVDTFETRGDSALNIAAYNGYKDIVNILLENGASLDKRGKDGMTALLWAAQQDELKVVDLLLNRGARLDIRSRVRYTTLTLF